ncbi:PD-(D/E)XK nuclease family protein [Streptomonospora alba]|nr:PD-(D/E)XK nuclease family protein [Streptomonospora alba]
MGSVERAELATSAPSRAERSEAEIAIAAHTTAIGRPARWPPPEEWGQPFPLLGPHRPPGYIRRVRVIEIGLMDGSRNVLFDGAPEEAKARYEERGRHRHIEIVAGGAPRPGTSCVDCKALMVCEERIWAPGLLGVRTRQAPLRTVSASDLRYHRQCPAQYHMRALKLPKADEYAAEHRRGKAVHAWLEDAHRRAAVHGQPCTPNSVPEAPETWGETEWALPQEEIRLGIRMLTSHAGVCPFSSAISHSDPEPDLAFFDAYANAVVLAKPDLLFYEDGAPVWRETKTRRSGATSRRELFRRYPQLALGLLILHGGHLGEQTEGARVELEVLYPDRLPDLIFLHADDPIDVEAAKEVLYSLTRSWHGDTSYPAHPHEDACRRCPVSHWCPDAALPKEE